ncbi:MAG: YggS family pyridoxal phosphate-dependent enzyme [marine benthic group bacterium]|nr:YggS family pyridoxal phosphate-dependent enzyme [Gemmatimonadota bacterium]
MNHEEIQERAARVFARVREAAERAGRDPSVVELLPITKGHGASILEAVAAAGFDRVGENRVAEADAKRGSLTGLDLEWCMVGHVQRNKAARVIRVFDRVESVDSLRLASKLSAEVEKADRAALPVLVQVNASGEASKGGFPVEAGPARVAEVCELPGLRVEGLMTMAPFVDDEELLRSVFRRTRELNDRCRLEIEGYAGEVLSMGMSNDFELAVEEGSTELRLGTILVGKRPGQ